MLIQQVGHFAEKLSRAQLTQAFLLAAEVLEQADFAGVQEEGLA